MVFERIRISASLAYRYLAGKDTHSNAPPVFGDETDVGLHLLTLECCYIQVCRQVAAVTAAGSKYRLLQCNAIRYQNRLISGFCVRAASAVGLAPCKDAARPRHYRWSQHIGQDSPARKRL